MKAFNFINITIYVRRVEGWVPLLGVDGSGLQMDSLAGRVVSQVTEVVEGSEQLYFGEIPPTLLAVPTALPQVPPLLMRKRHKTRFEMETTNKITLPPIPTMMEKST
jgi:hypothetical protein